MAGCSTTVLIRQFLSALRQVLIGRRMTQALERNRAAAECLDETLKEMLDR